MVGRDQAHAVGRAARRGADQLVLTTQRWSLDDPAGALAPGLLDGARDASGASLAVEPDRSVAIEHALRSARPGDLVLILDRGELAASSTAPTTAPGRSTTAPRSTACSRRSASRMRIVLGLHEFSGFAGTQTYVLTVAGELQRLGHEVLVHATSAGPIAEVARARGIPVVEAPERLPSTCDAVIAHDAGSAFALAARYPETRRLFVAHSDFYALQSPPQLEGVCHAVVVLNDRVRRHVEHLGATLPVIRLRQPVDLKRFGSRGGMSRHPGARWCWATISAPPGPTRSRPPAARRVSSRCSAGCTRSRRPHRNERSRRPTS